MNFTPAEDDFKQSYNVHNFHAKYRKGYLRVIYERIWDVVVAIIIIVWSHFLRLSPINQH